MEDDEESAVLSAGRVVCFQDDLYLIVGRRTEMPERKDFHRAVFGGPKNVLVCLGQGTAVSSDMKHTFSPRQSYCSSA